MRIGVTGGSGFIGSHVVDALVGVGHDVAVLDLQTPHRSGVEHRSVDLMTGDLKAATAGLQVVFHLAAYADVNEVDRAPEDAISLNVTGTLRVLEAARANAVSRVVLASTVWVYSSLDVSHGERTATEDDLISIQADRHIYTTSKIASEMLCRDYWHMHKVPFTILRYGIPYGPRMRPSLVLPIFVRRALAGEALTLTGDGSQHRKFVYVEDLARAHALCLSDAGRNETFNVDGSEKVTILQIAETALRLTGSQQPIEFVPARAGDYGGVDVSSEKARRLLGWESEVAFEEGARRTVEWLVSQQTASAAGAP